MTNQNNTSVEETPPPDGHIHKCVECSLNFYDKPMTNQNKDTLQVAIVMSILTGVLLGLLIAVITLWIVGSFV